MRGLMMVLALSFPAAVLADGDPKSLAPPPPPPATVEAVPLPAAITEPVAPPPMAVAAEPAPAGPAAPVRSEGFGADVRYWVATQVSGTLSVPDQRPMPGEVAKRAYDRYLKSFEYPIPETFKREAFTSGSSGGGSR